MAATRFDLNDIEREPSDLELAALMEAVTEEVRRREQVLSVQMLELLRRSIMEARRLSDIG